MVPYIKYICQVKNIFSLLFNSVNILYKYIYYIVYTYILIYIYINQTKNDKKQQKPGKYHKKTKKQPRSENLDCSRMVDNGDRHTRTKKCS